MEYENATWKEMKGWRERGEGKKEGEKGDEMKTLRSAERR